MGSCFSKKKEPSSPPEVPAPASSSTQHPVAVDAIKLQKNDKEIGKKGEKEEEEEAGLVKKEIFVIKHRKSHDKRSLPNHDQQNESAVETYKEESGNNNNVVNVVRTSSCTKEEVDAILIQCGRLSRSNSSGKAASSARKYSGSKRSYDFDHNDVDGDKKIGSDDDDDHEDDQRGERRQHRQRHRQSSGRSPSQGRRRTPSRERDQQQRSGSRERGGSGRRVSRSPGRRSENNSLATTATDCKSNRPGKMVSVPATVTSLVMDKSNNGVVEPATAIKRITVKRNAGEAAGVGSRTAASPRSQSPARANANVNKKTTSNEPSLSRNSSRKAEHSPYRRNPLSEIDANSLAYPQSSTPNIKPPTNNNNRVQNRSREVDGEGVLLFQKPNVDQLGSQGINYKVSSSRGTTLNNKLVNTICTEKEQQQILGDAKAQIPITTMAAASGSESQKPQTSTRSRSSRRSTDLDLNPETLLNPTPSYTALLLEDIQNFHQKKNNTPSFSIPPCVTKACSILEAVADLNSTTSSNLSCAFSVGKHMREAKDPFVETEVLASDDLKEPSFHKYVTVRRGGGGTLGGSDLDEQESSGSNSYVGGATQQNWSFSSTSWEPNSADSTDRWTSRANTKEDDKTCSVGHQRHALSETGKGVNGKKRDNYLHHEDGVWRGGVGASKGLQTVPVLAAAAST